MDGKMAIYTVCKYFPPNLTRVTALPCETQMLSLNNVVMYYLQQTICQLN